MGFTAEQRAKALASRKANKVKRAKDAHVEITSTADVPSERERKLLDEIKALEQKLGYERVARTEAEQAAIRAVESQQLIFGGENEEKPTGEFVTVERLDRYKVVGHKENGQRIVEPVFKQVKVPTFAYKVNMPPCGGIDLKINEIPFYHGAVYTLDIDSLRTIKDIVYRLWDHDRQIHGSDENAYRKPTNRVFSART